MSLLRFVTALANVEERGHFLHPELVDEAALIRVIWPWSRWERPG